MYFGGIWGGQLQRWKKNQYQGKTDNHKKNEVARLQRIAKLSAWYEKPCRRSQKSKNCRWKRKPFHGIL